MSCIIILILIFGSGFVPTSANIHIQKAVDKPFQELEWLMNKIWNENAHSRDLIVVFYQNSGRGGENFKNTSLITKDISFPNGKPTQVYDSIEFEKILKETFIPKYLQNADVIFLADFRDKKMTIPFIRYESCFIICVSPLDTRLGYSAVINGIVMLDKNDMVYVLDFRPYANCHLSQSTFRHESKYRIKEVMLSKNIHIKRMPQKYLKEECKVEMVIDLISHRFSSVNMTVEEFKNNPVFKILSTISEYQKTTIIPSRIFRLETHLLFIEGNFVLRQEPHEALVYLGTEDIVWLIVNTPNSLLNLKAVMQTSAVVGCVLGVTLLFGNMLNRFLLNPKVPFVRLLLLAWSIFLSLSIPRQPNKVIPRTIFLSWTISSSVLITCYYVKSYKALSFPTISRIHTQVELMESDIPILVLSKAYANIAFNKDDFENSNFDDIRPFDVHFENSNTTSYFDRISRIMESKEQAALLLDYQQAIRFLTKFSDSTYYFLPEKVATYPIFAHGMRADKYLMLMRKKVEQLTATGIVSHFMKAPDLKKERGSLVSSIPLNYMLNVYILLVICIVICCMVFAVELIVFYCFDKRGPQLLMKGV